MAQPLFRQLGNKSVPKLLEKINYTDLVNTMAGGTGVPASAELVKTLNSSVVTETSNRINGDLAIIDGASVDYSTLSKIETIIKANKSSDAQALSDAIDVVEASLESEVSAREAADTAISNTLAQEVSDRVSAVAGEKSAREAADASLTSAIAQEVSDRTSAMSSEVNSRTTADNAIQASLDAEIAARISAVSAEKLARESADGVLDGKIGTEKIERQADVSLLTAALVQESTDRSSADSVHDSRMSALESGMATGAQLKGVVETLAEFDTFVEAEQVEGWFYKVKSGTTGTSDIYMVASSFNNAYDYVPVGWVSKGLIWLMDFADVTNSVTIEKNERILGDNTLDGKITLLSGVVASNKSVIDATIVTLRNDMENEDNVLDVKLDSEIADRTTAVTNEKNSRIAADDALTVALHDEVVARQDAITLEATTRSNADAGLQVALEAEAAARVTAVGNEAAARLAADGVLQDNVNSEIANRISAVTAEQEARIAADTALSNRVSVVEGTELVDGSIKKALLDAKKYADMYIPVPMLEGTDGSLLVVSDTVTLTYAPHRGLNGISLGECIVYLLNGDSVMVTVLNVVGNVVTLSTATAGEYDGCGVKIQYQFINADQNGAGMGVAGEGGAGL